MEEEGEVHRRGPLVLCLFGGEEYCCVEDPFGLDSHQQAPDLWTYDQDHTWAGARPVRGERGRRI
jgi:hypothetical protein